MRIRYIFVATGSLVLGLALIKLAVVFSGLPVSEIEAKIAHVSKAAIVQLGLLIALNSFLSSCKWRLIDRHMRDSTTEEISAFEAFALTSLGNALGQVLPVQLSMSVSRTLGTRFHGRAIRRGALGTLFEQSFDFGFACFLMLASIATRLLHGGAFFWCSAALLCSAVAIVCGGAAMALARTCTTRLTHNVEHASNWRKHVYELNRSGLLRPETGCGLMSLSALRFVVLVLAAGEVGRAIHSDIPLWHFGFAMPAAVIATAAAITPGALGILEITYAGALAMVGTPLAATTAIALANRVLGSAVSIVVALLLLPILMIARRQHSRTCRELQKERSDPLTCAIEQHTAAEY